MPLVECFLISVHSLVCITEHILYALVSFGPEFTNGKADPRILFDIITESFDLSIKRLLIDPSNYNYELIAARSENIFPVKYFSQQFSRLNKQSITSIMSFLIIHDLQTVKVNIHHTERLVPMRFQFLHSVLHGSAVKASS